MADGKGLSRASFILPHPAEESRLLLVRDGGDWALPHVEYEGGWFAEDVGLLSRLVRERLGVRVSVLRHLVEGEHHVGVLENHDAGWSPPASARWAGRGEIADIPLAVPEHRPLLERWLVEAAREAQAPALVPWERPGWLAQASAWFAEQAARSGRPLTGPVEQRKGAWDGSCILRAPAGDEPLWFKAVYQRPPAEPAVIRLLAERWPDNVPAILAADHERRWMLMRDFGGTPLEGQPPAAWDEAARLFGRIQRDTAGRLDRWLALGCLDRRPAAWPGELRALLADGPALLGVERGMDAADIDRLTALLPEVDALCAELDAYGIPAAMVQQDFRHENLVVTGDTFCYFDWSDTVAGHPFMSGNRFLDYLSPPEGVDRFDWRLAHPEDTLRRRLRDAYLEPWTAEAPIERLQGAFALSRRLNPLYQAARWYGELRYIRPGAPWFAEIQPAPSRYLKRFLRDLVGDI